MEALAQFNSVLLNILPTSIQIFVKQAPLPQYSLVILLALLFFTLALLLGQSASQSSGDLQQLLQDPHPESSPKSPIKVKIPKTKTSRRKQKSKASPTKPDQPVQQVKSSQSQQELSESEDWELVKSRKPKRKTEQVKQQMERRIWDSIMHNTEEREIYTFDQEVNDAILQTQPWGNDVHYFKRVRISAVALVKMVMHAISGGTIEIMGLMTGKINGEEIIVLDAFGLPVEGTQTRVNAGASANEYQVKYHTSQEAIGKNETVCGWYHSHPGYGCWFSGIDVGTQRLHQTSYNPYLGIVIDPIRTLSSGKVEIGCFRTYPQNYQPPNSGASQYQHIPLDKIQDFGVHYQCYYTLEHSYFKSSVDNYILNLLWNKYWTQTLSSSPLLKNKDYAAKAIVDLSDKLANHEKMTGRGNRGFMPHRNEESPLQKISMDAAKVGTEQAQGLVNLLLKKILFYQPNFEQLNGII